MYTVEEFKSASSAFNKRFGFRFVLVLGLLILLAIPVGLLLKQHGDELAEWYVREVGGHKSLMLIVLALSVLIALLFGTFLGVGRTARRDPRLWCPHCGQRLGTVVNTTGNCGRCGKQALAPFEQDIGPEENPSVTVEEFKRAVAVARKRALLSIGAVFFSFFAYLGLVAAAKPLILAPGLHGWARAGTNRMRWPFCSSPCLSFCLADWESWHFVRRGCRATTA